jgi:hypothetical protein
LSTLVARTDDRRISKPAFSGPLDDATVRGPSDGDWNAEEVPPELRDLVSKMPPEVREMVRRSLLDTVARLRIPARARAGREARSTAVSPEEVPPELRDLTPEVREMVRRSLLDTPSPDSESPSAREPVARPAQPPSGHWQPLSPEEVPPEARDLASKLPELRELVRRLREMTKDH